MSSDLLSVDHITKVYSRGGVLSRIAFAAVDNVSFSLEAARPEIFPIIGESGSGKTTLARIILNMIVPTSGTMTFRGTDFSKILGRRGRLEFMRHVQPIFQNPFEAFNPLKRVERPRPLPLSDKCLDRRLNSFITEINTSFPSQGPHEKSYLLSRIVFCLCHRPGRAYRTDLLGFSRRRRRNPHEADRGRI